tara:strand:- start:10002 stop:10265 length:264 start_codon:yes stop_codon:yes gene_type:complete
VLIEKAAEQEKEANKQAKKEEQIAIKQARKEAKEAKQNLLSQMINWKMNNPGNGNTKEYAAQLLFKMPYDDLIPGSSDQRKAYNLSC